MKVLILCFGNFGGVLRSTTILRLFPNDNIIWVVDNQCLPIFDYVRYQGLHVIGFDYDTTYKKLKDMKFDWIINLDEDRRAVALYELLDTLNYSCLTKTWLAMGIDNNLKKKNTKSYQWHMFKALDKKFNGEEYVFEYPVKINRPKIKMIGIETRVGNEWSTKNLSPAKWKELDSELEILGFKTHLFKQTTFEEYVRQVALCDLIITPDTMTMHLAIALKKPTVAIFTCTSAAEIYGYGRVTKMVAEVKCKCSYKRKCYDYDHEVCIRAIKVEDIVKEVLRFAALMNISNQELFHAEGNVKNAQD